MAVSRAMRRLLRVRELEEEQSRLALESALGELNRLRNALNATAERDRRGRRLVAASAQTGEVQDRLAGLVESRAAGRLADVLSARIETAAQEAAELQQSFLVRRVERRQVETLIEETEAQDEVEASRRGQQALDDWHRSRQPRAGSGTQAGTNPACAAGAEGAGAGKDGDFAAET